MNAHVNSERGLSVLRTRMRQLLQFIQLSSTARAVRRDGLTYLSEGKLRRIENILSELLKANTEGSIMEFGVALGGSAIIMAKHAVRAGRPFHGFDVFGIIPPPTSEKDDAKSRERYRVIASGQSRGINGATYYGYKTGLYAEVCASFDRYGLPVDGLGITLHKGLFEETLPHLPKEPIGFAHIDCDWYDPVKFCLEQIADRVVSGGVIVLDDYHDYGGCKTATDEFLATRDDFTAEPGANLILRRR